MKGPVGQIPGIRSRVGSAIVDWMIRTSVSSLEFSQLPSLLLPNFLIKDKLSGMVR
jgi:hypothetical protein